MKPIHLTTIDYSEPLQFIEEYFEITLDNGFDCHFFYRAEIIIAENIGASFYDENQPSIEIINPEIEVFEVWDGDNLVELDEIAEKELKQELLKWIE